ncbi:MAG: hypothetical protein ACO305_18720 [Rubrivivax sp.]
MWTRIVAFLTWAAVAASGVFWGLRLLAVPAAVPAGVAAAAPSAAPTADLQRLLGAAPAAAGPADGTDLLASPGGNAPGGLVLSGVIAAPSTATPAAGVSRGARGGIALISVAGQPARPFRVGDRLQGNWVLLEVQARAALVGPAGGPPAFALMLPEKSANARSAAAPPSPLALPAPEPGPVQQAQTVGEAAPAGGSGALPPDGQSEDTAPAETPGASSAGAPSAGAAPTPGRMTLPETDALKRMGPLTR